MNNSDKENDRDSGEEQLEFEPSDSWQPRNQLFDDLDENEEFEEPDRDSDYASVYTEVEEVEPDLDDGDSYDRLDDPETAVEPAPWEENDIAAEEPGPSEGAGAETWAALSALRTEEQDVGLRLDESEPDEAWDDEVYDGDEERKISLPIGMIAVGIVALILLGAGGYGVMQDRAALQEEIRQLQANLATTASPAEVSQVRATSEKLTSRNRELEQQVADLSRENGSLQSIIGGLETQLRAQQEALEVASTPPPAPVAKKIESKPAPKTPASTSGAKAATGEWFVNFGSYSQRTTAESWADRLKPTAGDVIVSTGEKDGRTFYRVRVINLASEKAANDTARKLERDYDLSRLWVGRDR